MFYKPEGNGDLSQAEMDRVRKGFTGLLAKLRYHPEFILNHCDELLGIAHTEYVRYLSKGVEIEDPVAWTINCAWRRTQNLLTLQGYRPQKVSAEKLAELVDEGRPTPDQIALDTDRARKVHRAVAKLDEEQRQLLALMYFEDMPLAEAARCLDWHESKARRCHKAALTRLYKSLAVKSSDQLVAEVGLVAWLSFAAKGSAPHLPAGFEAALDKAGQEASGLWARAHELARRFNLGGGSDAAGAVATSGAGRAAGVCATVAVACVIGASGVVGPGVGGIGLLGGHDRPPPAKTATRGGEASTSLTAASAEAVSPTATASGEGSGSQSPSASPGGEASGRKSAKASSAKTERHQVKEQTDAFARASSESSTTTVTTASPSSTAASTETSGPSDSATPNRSSSEATQTKQQFGAFR
jgi:DNA-directed RNA polymerase specialized sigma24 family protein